MYKQYSGLLSGADEDDRMVDYWTRQWSALSTGERLANLSSSRAWHALGRYVRSGERIIEAGCGLAQWVVFLDKAGYQVMGVDVACPPLVSARKLFPGTKLAQADVRALPFSDGVFGVYMSLGVLEHFEDGPGAVLCEARRVLGRGGVLLITVPLHTWLTKLAAVVRERREGRACFFQYLYTPKELRELLERHGFWVVEMSALDSRYTMACLFPTVYRAAGESWRAARGGRRALVLAAKVLCRLLDRVAYDGLCGHMQMAVATCEAGG